MVATHTPSLRFRLAAGAVAEVVAAVAVVVAVVVRPRGRLPTPVNAVWAVVAVCVGSLWCGGVRHWCNGKPSRDRRGGTHHRTEMGGGVKQGCLPPPR